MEKNENKYASVLIVILTIVASYQIFQIISESNHSQLEVTENITFPNGYQVVAVSSQGKYVDAQKVHFFCEENNTKETFFCDGGEIGEKIPLPEGCSLVGATSFGGTLNDGNLTFYCQDEKTNQIIELKYK